MAILEELINKGKTGNHETFTPRYGWLKKGYERCKGHPHVFNAKDAIEQLGVGKNMVRSTRFWCLLFSLLEKPTTGEDIEAGSLKVSELGYLLLDDAQGYDPYIEDPATLWLLHWQIFVPPFDAVSWPLAFNYCSLAHFNHNELKDAIIDATKNRDNLERLSPNSYDKDASCIIRMYAGNKGKSDIYCPFTSLDLIQPLEGDSQFKFNIGIKRTLPELIFLAACFSYAAVAQKEARSISLHQLVYGTNSPGIAFKMTETDCGHAIETTVAKIDGVNFVESAGIRQLQFSQDPNDLYWQCINAYYNSQK